MDDEDRSWTVEGLADVVGVPVRTIRYYITEGLLPGPGTRGKGTVYTEEHLLRLRLIRLLTEQRVPLAQIRDQLAGLSLPEVDALLEHETRHAGLREQAAQARSPRDYVSALLDRARASGRPATDTQSPRRLADAQPSALPAAAAPWSASEAEPEPEPTWRRYELESGVELHVRSDAGARHGALIERLLEVAKRPGNRQTH